MPHDGGFNDAFIVVNTKTDEMWVWMKFQGKLSRLGLELDPSGLSTDAKTALAKEKGRKLTGVRRPLARAPKIDYVLSGYPCVRGPQADFAHGATAMVVV